MATLPEAYSQNIQVAVVYTQAAKNAVTTTISVDAIEEESEINDPNAIALATVDAEGLPNVRMVLLKEIEDGGFVFYTNLGSKKAQDLAINDKISLHFPWHILERQVKICGTAHPLSTAEVAKYFLSRPRESQLAAWASQQSKPISTRQALMSKFEEIKNKFSEGDITLPSFWGGYRVVPHEIEFWQGGEHRLHNRFVYTKQDNGSWDIQRLMP